MQNQETVQLTIDAGTAKLTGWSNEPTTLNLKNDFEVAKSYHDTMVIKIDHWNDLMQITGKVKPPKVKGRSSIQPKLIRRQAEWRYSALTEPFLSSNKLYKVSPVTFEDANSARQNELVLNWQWRTKLNKVKFIDDYVRSTVDEGTCIVRIGWNRRTSKVKQKVPVYTHVVPDQNDIQVFQQALTARNDDPRTFKDQAPPELVAALEYYDESGQATVAHQSGVEEQIVDKVIENCPVYDIINPKNFYIDPTCNGDLDKALFAIVSFETCKADLLKQPDRYKNLDKVQWENNTPLTDNNHASINQDNSQGFRDILRKKVVAYEYWGFYDINGTGELVPIVATWIGDVLIRMEENPFPDQKLPFVLVPYLPVKRDLFGEPDAELLEDNQAILGALSRGMIDLMGRSANGQQGFAKGMLDPMNRRRYENGQDYEFNPNVSPAQGLIEHKYPEIPQSAMLMLNLQNSEAEALTGVKSFSGGMSGQAYGEVAAGIRGVLDAASKREMAILRRLAKGMVDIGVKTIAMNQKWMSAEETIRVTNTQFEKIKREEIQGNFDLEVDISTAEVDDAKAKDLGFMLQTIGPNAGIEIVLMILTEIALLKRMPELAHKLQNYKPAPDPIAEQMKQLALMKAQKEIEELQSRIDLNKAKASETNSNKDLKDLDYVETETGTKHARRMDEIGSQARSNQDLAVTNALLKPRKPDETKPNIPAAVGYNELSRKLDAHTDHNPMNNDPNPLNRDAVPVDNIQSRDELANQDPRYSLGSKYFQPDADPSLNPSLNV